MHICLKAYPNGQTAHAIATLTHNHRKAPKPMTPLNIHENRGRPSNIQHIIFDDHRTLLKAGLALAYADYYFSGHWKFRVVAANMEYEIQFRKRLGLVKVATEFWAIPASHKTETVLPTGWHLKRMPCGNTHTPANGPAIHQTSRKQMP